MLISRVQTCGNTVTLHYGIIGLFDGLVFLLLGQLSAYANTENRTKFLKYCTINLGGNMSLEKLLRLHSAPAQMRILRRFSSSHEIDSNRITSLEDAKNLN